MDKNQAMSYLKAMKDRAVECRKDISILTYDGDVFTRKGKLMIGNLDHYCDWWLQYIELLKHEITGL